MTNRPRVAVFKFASCDGCQLSLLDAEDELLLLCGKIEIATFAEASSKLQGGPYDVTLVEGSITTPEDAKRIQEIRKESSYLVTIGACATAGGIQALRNWATVDEWMKYVYPHPEYIETLATSTPIAEHVNVDFELRGCPVNRFQLVEVILSLAAGLRPKTPSHSVCLDCKKQGNVCVTVARNEPCLGPITQSGCGALCPSFDRGCYGCFGPAHQNNTKGLMAAYGKHDFPAQQLVPLLRNFNASAPDFQEASDALATRAGTEEAP